jgi:hypothetical protein
MKVAPLQNRDNPLYPGEEKKLALYPASFMTLFDGKRKNVKNGDLSGYWIGDEWM